MYAMLAQIMPRTGGDYVFNSRSLHPSLGFAANFSFCFWLAIIYGVYTTYLAAYGFGAFGRMMAGFTGSAGWLDFGDWFSNDYALFITGTVAVLLSAVVFVVGGLRLFLRLQVGAFALYIARHVPAARCSSGCSSEDRASSRTSTTTRPTSAHGQRGGARSTTSATDAGFAPTGFDTETTLKSVSVFWYIFGFLYSSNYFAGEIRLRKRTHLRLDPGRAAGRGGRSSALLLPAYLRVTGYDFNGDARLRRPGRLRLRRRRARVPGDDEHRRPAAGCFGAIIIIGFTVGLLIWLPQTMLLISRSMFAWSFDRIMPARLSYVDSRTHSPVIAIGDRHAAGDRRAPRSTRSPTGSARWRCCSASR